MDHIGVKLSLLGPDGAAPTGRCGERTPRLDRERGLDRFLTFPATSYFPLLVLLLTDPMTRVLQRALGGARRPTHMGE